MASYNDLGMPLSTQSTDNPVDNMMVERALDGTLKVRVLQTGPKKAFVLVHEHINMAEKASLEAFYANNRAVNFTLTWVDNVVYTCAFTAPLQFTAEGGPMWTAVVTFEEV